MAETMGIENMILGTMAGAVVVLAGALYALFFALGRLQSSNAFMLASLFSYVLLAAVSPDELDRFVRGDLAKPTPATVTGPAKLRRLIKKAGSTGHAWTHEAWAEGINGAAAPVVDAEGNVVAAINLYGPSYRFPGSRSEAAIAEALIESAEQVSRHLGGPV